MVFKLSKQTNIIIRLQASLKSVLRSRKENVDFILTGNPFAFCDCVSLGRKIDHVQINNRKVRHTTRRKFMMNGIPLFVANEPDTLSKSNNQVRRKEKKLNSAQCER